MIKFIGIHMAERFAAEAGAMFARKQQYIDKETVRRMEPYTPKDTGRQIDIGASGTLPGSGTVQYNSSIARRNYYTNAGRGKGGQNARSGTKGLRGKMWFERMKADHKDEIMKGAQKIE